VLIQQQATSTPVLLKLPVWVKTGAQASPKLGIVPVLSMSTRASGGLQQNPTITNDASRHVGSYSAREMDAPSGEVCSPGRMRILVEDPELRRPTLGDSNGWLVLCRISIPVFKNLRTCTGVQVGEA
jgi:hypothetical protein